MHGCHYIHNACDGIAIVIVTIHVTESLGYGITRGDMAGWILQGCAIIIIGLLTGITFRKMNDKYMVVK